MDPRPGPCLELVRRSTGTRVSVRNGKTRRSPPFHHRSMDAVAPAVGDHASTDRGLIPHFLDRRAGECQPSRPGSAEIAPRARSIRLPRPTSGTIDTHGSQERVSQAVVSDSRNPPNPSRSLSRAPATKSALHRIVRVADSMAGVLAAGSEATSSAPGIRNRNAGAYVDFASPVRAGLSNSALLSPAIPLSGSEPRTSRASSNTRLLSGSPRSASAPNTCPLGIQRSSRIS